MDFDSLLLTLFNHERYTSIGVLISLGVLLFIFGCQPKCRSLLTDEMITRGELVAEIEMINAKAENAELSLQQQEDFQKFLLEQGVIIAAGGGVNPIGIITSLAGILGVGATVDNVRKRVTIKKMEIANSGTSTEKT